ncbi:MAG: isopentenyl phosphate kinase [archaeon]
MNNGKDLVFIKLGGSAITFKDQPGKANFKVLDRSAAEIAEIAIDYNLLVGHGGGSFPHPVAQEYKVQEGIKICGTKGFVETQNAVRKINSLVVKSLVDKGVPVVPIQTSACAVMSKGEITEMYLDPIKEALKNRMVPVLNGDVLFDLTTGCGIASTEMIFNYLAKKLGPKRIILGANVDGVYAGGADGGKLIARIDKNNKRKIIEELKEVEPAVPDVTGSMAHKVEELYNLSKLDIGIQIVNMLKEGYLKRAVQGEHLGTIIHV